MSISKFGPIVIATLGALAISQAASADPVVTGTVNVNGFVTASCAVVPPATSGGVWGSIALGELDDPSTGQLKASLQTSAAQGVATPGSNGFVTVSIICNSASPSVTLSATSLGDGVTAQAGQTSRVDYTAQIDLDLAAGGAFTATYPTTGAGGPQSPGTSLGGPLATTTGNVRVSVHSLSATGVLTAGTYGTPGGTGGVISITITPT